MELQEMWAQLLSVIIAAVSSVSIPTVIGMVFYGITKGKIQKEVAKINAQEISEKVVENGLNLIKNATFKQDITPIVKSELQKVYEVQNENIDNHYKELIAQNQKMLKVMEKFYAYFNDSLVATEEKKAELYSAIENAKLPQISNEIEFNVNLCEEPQKTAKNGKETAKNNISVIR